MPVKIQWSCKLERIVTDVHFHHSLFFAGKARNLDLPFEWSPIRSPSIACKCQTKVEETDSKKCPSLMRNTITNVKKLVLTNGTWVTIFMSVNNLVGL